LSETCSPVRRIRGELKEHPIELRRVISIATTGEKR
jgi:hypothetical protein